MSTDWVVRLPLDKIGHHAGIVGIPAALLAAHISVESDGDQFAMRYEPIYRYTYAINQYAHSLNISPLTEEILQKISWGYCQIMGGTARSMLGFNQQLGKLNDADLNISLGAKLIKINMNRFGEEDSISAYNAGSPRRTPGGMYDNQSYVDKVNSKLAVLRQVLI